MCGTQVASMFARMVQPPSLPDGATKKKAVASQFQMLRRSQSVSANLRHDPRHVRDDLTPAAEETVMRGPIEAVSLSDRELNSISGGVDIQFGPVGIDGDEKDAGIAFGVTMQGATGLRSQAMPMLAALKGVRDGCTGRSA
ncbi:hypothetical protein MTX26_23325 [Bradyrhizobium sp. ISRA443]|uniref:hypothetical protein n=1 Tax=unclassified Bradyrhizobium TaxID=2631580 RepID=UPI00247A1969|nr:MULTISPECIES: hypothetical protein [unclassified Bradyrhizobium]WGR97350.1 hypothetical protein MTX23_23325 [Bradyrhizobium sp. ISRA436]WGS04239.1 hypothetical protein MTX18_23325 [Bradyrhizobium sp. ISRA437]WGS11122.1 hypothetical protein MTX26_23325 [Bradyrhizobium sp. ISRA443]